MNFICYPIVISKTEGKPLPTPQSIMNDLIGKMDIPLRLITDKEDVWFKDLQQQVDFQIEFIIVTIKYLNTFRA